MSIQSDPDKATPNLAEGREITYQIVKPVYKGKQSTKKLFPLQ
jgi:hypothetical protein